ncbi:TPA: DEAD/DEAH box helicase, partial [Candidatus Micrarchaeota archaeon]|nr:DEAD/DEAH box helicase [Candidatus Micrarchaeota archaeon]
ESGICALYITPLRSLNRDLLRRFSWWCDRLDISHGIRHGDTTPSERAKQRKNPPKILLTTIESLQALLMGRILRRHLLNVEFVVCDEIHDVLDNKRGVQLSLGLERLEEIADFRRIGISATVANESEAGRLLFGQRPYALCEAGKNRKMDISVEDLKAQEERVKRISRLVTDSRSLVFVNTRSMAEELGASLIEKKAPIEVHHGSLDKNVRTHTEDRFKEGALRSVMCTSSLELGIDVGDVDLVVQYGSPHQVSRLIQRVGRSGHSLQGTPRGVMMSTDFDDMLECEVVKILAGNGWIEGKPVERGSLDVIAHQVVGLCLDFGRMPLAKIHNILNRSYAYGITYDKLRKVALQLYGEGLVFYDEAPDGSIHIKTTRRAREYYYSYLSTIPKMKRYLMKDISANRIISSLDEEFVMNLESGASFLSKGQPWRVVDITEDEVLAEPGGSMDIAVPAWTGEDIPVPYEVAQEVGIMRGGFRPKAKPLPDHKTVVIEMFSDVVVVHACFGSQVNEGIARIFADNLSQLVGESVKAVSDPYRIMVKLPFALKEEHILRAFRISDVRSRLEQSLTGSLLLKFKFLHVGRLFGLLSEDATVGRRFIEAMRNSVVYEEAVRSVFFRYFDVPRTEKVIERINKGQIKVVVDKRSKPSFFAKLGIERASGGEKLGAFEPREKMVAAFKENALSKTLRLQCINCGAKRFLHLAGAPEKIKCSKCGQPSYALADREGIAKGDAEFSAALIREFGKRGLIALSTYGIGPKTADRILRRLHKDESLFYLDILEAQKHFIKNKKFWKP